MARATQNTPQQMFRSVIVDQPADNICYLVCYTVTCAMNLRITSIVKCTQAHDELEYRRIFRNDNPGLWTDIRNLI